MRRVCYYLSNLYTLYRESHCTMTLGSFTCLFQVRIKCKFYEKSNLELSNKKDSDCSNIQNRVYEQGGLSTDLIINGVGNNLNMSP